MFRSISKYIFLFLILLSMGTAQATLWTFDTVLSGSNGGFGYSSFHDASGSSPMSGTSYGSILNTSVSGTYNDVSGLFSGSFETSSTTFTLDGTLLFGSDGFLASSSVLDIDFTTNTSNLVDGTIGFMPGDVCCNATVGLDPNSFDASQGIMSLWGAGGANAIYNYATNDYYHNQTLGMDIRLEMTAVPEPSIIALFAVGLIGMGFSARKRQK